MVIFELPLMLYDTPEYFIVISNHTYIYLKKAQPHNTELRSIIVKALA